MMAALLCIALLVCMVGFALMCASDANVLGGALGALTMWCILGVPMGLAVFLLWPW